MKLSAWILAFAFFIAALVFLARGVRIIRGLIRNRKTQ